MTSQKSGDRTSIQSEAKEPAEETETKQPQQVVGVKKDSSNVISCIIELKVVWFNFAAPPRTPITKKIDYTR